MILISLLCIFLGAASVYCGVWYTFITLVNVLQKGKYVPLVLLLSLLLFSIGVTLFMLGVLI